MFNKILIANRGEIACRVIKTARRMGIRTVAVYSEADAGARHVRLADEAVCIGAPPPRESYLVIDKIIGAALATGAQAIHPGYGFLSENEEFAEACAKNGIAFVGPPVSAIRATGLKSESKKLMETAGVPLTPGYHGDNQDAGFLRQQADAIGYPVLIKASAGGGGKGMRAVWKGEEFAEALASCQREAKSSFGDQHVLIEKYLQRPRHIEIQVFGDTHGRVVSLFERDCSVQRRHQKVLEEAPAPGMTRERRRAMGEAAVAAAKAIGYVGAGTVEFIAEQDGRFYFMEMNTRLQVEHPVTEMVTGLDLVEWQLRVAAGEPLPLAQDELAIRGHAIEARLYAEDPDRGFLPSIGRIAHWRMPEPSARVRIDTGFSSGDEVSPWYDPMLAKLVVWGEDRERACATMLAALAECEIAGVSTNVAFLERVVAHEAFATGRLDTGLIEKHHGALVPPAGRTPALALVAAAIDELAHLVEAAVDDPSDPHSPWRETDAWWVNSASHAVVLRYLDGDARCEVRVTGSLPEVAVEIDGRRTVVRAMRAAEGWSLDTGERRIGATVVRLGDDRLVFAPGMRRRLAFVDPLAHAGEEEVHAGHLAAPMSGTIVAVPAKVGDRVERGAPLVVLEAMKMEHSIVAPAAGIVAAIHFRVGDRVSEGADLVDLEDPPAA